ncbi:Holliday junction resolvase RuvX [Patescibacteria group bacterium]|nr:Holliday junction resolvase RuvX [Patescibacteria group bacterium]
MLLSIDYGEKYIGLALASPEVSIATPYKTIIKKDSSWWQELREVILKEKISKIIIGYPLGLNSDSSEQTEKIKTFFKKCQQNFALPVFLFDERMTTKMAKKLSSVKKENHAIAASIILQDYLDRFAQN